MATDDTLQELARQFSRMSGQVDAVFASSASLMQELREELRLLRQATEDTRNRVTELEGRVRSIEDEQRRLRNDTESDRGTANATGRAQWQSLVLILIAAAGWAVAAAQWFRLGG